MDETIIKITKGEVVLVKPNAKARNTALMKAEKEGGVEPSKVTFIMELLPLCVKSHPFLNVPIRQALDSLPYEEYDLLSAGLSQLMKPLDKEDQKK